MLRSLLFAPASDEHKLRKALASAADGVVADLEDATAPDEKEAARGVVEAIFADAESRAARALRVNAPGTEWFEGDLELANRLELDLLMLPKATPETVAALGPGGHGDGPPAARHYTFPALVATEKRIAGEPASAPRNCAKLLDALDERLSGQRYLAGDRLTEAEIRLFTALDGAGLRWVVPRNHQDLPDRAGHDVDVIIRPADASRIDPLIRELVRRQELALLRAYAGIEHETFDVAAGDLSGRLLLHVDFQTAVCYRARLLVDATDLLAHVPAVPERGGVPLPVPEPAMEAYALLLHAALHKGALKAKYADRLAELRDADPGGLERLASERLGPASLKGFARQVTLYRVLRHQPP